MDNQTISSFQSFVMQNNFITEEDCKLFEPHILDRVPLYQIASHLGLERESLSRLKKRPLPNNVTFVNFILTTINDLN